MSRPRPIHLLAYYAVSNTQLPQNADYEAAGAKVVAADAAFGSDIILKVRAPDATKEVPKFAEGSRLISYIQPALNKDLVAKLQEKKMTVVGAPGSIAGCRARRTTCGGF